MNRQLPMFLSFVLAVLLAGARTALAVDPTNVSGCVLWLKADAGVLTNSTGKVTNWIDQVSGIVVANSSNAPSVPTVTASWKNSKPALNWASQPWPSYGLNVPGGSAVNIAATNDRTIFFVAGISASRTNINQVFGPDTTLAIELAGKGYTPAGGVRLRNNTVNTYADANLPDGCSCILAVVAKSNPTNINVYRDGNLVTITSTNANSVFYSLTDGFGIGWAKSTGDANRSYIGQVAEVIVYDRALEEEDRNTVEGYLSLKYAIPLVIPPPSVITSWAGMIRRDTSATLLGATPDQTADIRFLWSTNSALGETLTGWDGMTLITNVGVDSTATATATNLLPATPYYWRCHASNANGTAWSPTTNTFTTHATPLTVTPPPVVSGLVLNLDASSLSYANNQRFEWWPDVSGTTTEFVTNYAGAANWPTYIAAEAALGGKPVVRFARSRQLAGGAIPAIGANTNRTIFLVAIPSAAGGGLNDVFGCGDGLYTIDLAGPRTGGYPTNSARVRNSSTLYSATNSVSMGVPHIVAVTDEGGADPATRVYVDGAEAVPYMCNSNSTFRYFSWSMTNNMTVGGANENTRTYVGDLAQVLVYNRVLSAREQQSVGWFLQQKYSLPSGTYLYRQNGTIISFQ